MVDTIQINYTGQNAPFYYVRLGALLKYIQDNLMYIIQVDENNISPLLKFDTEVETNLMFAENLQISVDPNICLINRTLTDANTTIEYTFTNQNKQQAEPFESPLFTQQTYRCYGQIMNIYVHMKWVLLELDRLKDASTNKVVLIDFLNSMLSSISSALGGINNLEANVDEVTNTVIIRDKNPLPNNDLVIKVLNKFYKDKGTNKKLSNESAFFDLFGYSTEEYTPTNPVYNKTGHASFIKDFSFTTEITPQLSTMLTVGATANSEVVGENSTAFSRFNAGLIDRFKTKITTPKAPTTDWSRLITTFAPADPNQKAINDLDEEQKALNKQYGASYDKYIAYIKNLSYPNFIFNSEEADTYKTSVSNFINFAQQIREIKQKKENLGKKILPPYLPGTGFIPFNMSLTMDGLSGMKIYNKFNINTEYLPTNYPDIAEFLIKNVTHKIENNKWYTTLESIVTVKGEYKDKNGNILPGGSNGGGQNSSTPAASTNGQWANKLRDTLANLGYVEKGTDLDSGGDISENIYKAASQVLTTIKQELPQLQIRVTSGNDNFHQKLKDDSRHKRANAIDFTISPAIPSNLNAVVEILQRYAAGNSPNFRFIDEYRHKTKNGTGNHFHISWGAGTESQVELNKALALAKQNKISPLTIT
jgi:hypothetical protein